MQRESGTSPNGSVRPDQSGHWPKMVLEEVVQCLSSKMQQRSAALFRNIGRSFDIRHDGLCAATSDAKFAAGLRVSRLLSPPGFVWSLGRYPQGGSDSGRGGGEGVVVEVVMRCFGIPDWVASIRRSAHCSKRKNYTCRLAVASMYALLRLLSISKVTKIPYLDTEDE
ncbi:hypothetical protein GQ53DRAFT_763697 [Thozetella sp. PMI_491]|nr:hypothetical protein GQ53DRAFT_763697 [Thozetella sp. PMI_491]